LLESILEAIALGTGGDAILDFESIAELQQQSAQSHKQPK
jgi:hypothetical protein